jgi:hypothetical protein
LSFQPVLVHARRGARLHRPPNLRVARLERLAHLLGERLRAPQRRCRHVQQLPQHLHRLPPAHPVPPRQQRCHRAQPRPEAPPPDFHRQAGPRQLAALQAPHAHPLVLHYPRMKRRQLHHLVALPPLYLHRSRQALPAVPARRRPVLHHLVHPLRLQQLPVVAPVPRLPTLLPARRLLLPPLHPRRVRRRRPRRVLRVLPQPRFQLPYPPLQHHQRGFHRGRELFSGCFQLLDDAHATTLLRSPPLRHNFLRPTERLHPGLLPAAELGSVSTTRPRRNCRPGRAAYLSQISLGLLTYAVGDSCPKHRSLREPPVGIEPTTFRLQIECSTI